jgi:RNA polymerase sigma-70 factor, ECF subfamily
MHRAGSSVRLTLPGGNGQRDRPMIGPSFDAVLAAAARGHDEAFGILWRDLQPSLLRYLNALAPGAGEDLASETWLRVVGGLRRFSGDERSFRAWVFTIPRRRAVDRWRRTVRRRDAPVPLEALADLPAPDDPATAAVDAVSTRAAVALIATLPTDQAEVSCSGSWPASRSPRWPRSPASTPAMSGSCPTATSGGWPNSSVPLPGSGEGCNAMVANGVFPPRDARHPVRPGRAAARRAPRPRGRTAGLRRGGQGAAGRRRPALPGRTGRTAGRPGHVPQGRPPRQGSRPPGTVALAGTLAVGT